MSRYSISAFIFRRDPRVHDNTALPEALRLSEQVVIPCFIFDPRQLEPHPYQSRPGLQFMLQAITGLQQQVQAVGGHVALYHALPERFIKPRAEQKHIHGYETQCLRLSGTDY